MWFRKCVGRGRRKSSACQASRHAVEQLERRTLLNATLTSPIQPVGVVPGSTPTSIDLTQHFGDPNVPGTLVDVTTPQGVIPLALTDSRTPKTVANFLQYINNGEYQNTLFHRLATGFALQGGGFLTNGTHITQLTPVTSESGQSNVTDSIAMALSTGPNSGTSEWFVNLANNNGTGSTPNLDDTSDGGPFTVFGHVVYGGVAVVNAIAALPIINASTTNSAWNTLPVKNASLGATPSNEVTTTYSIVPALTYRVTSDNTSIVNPTVVGSTLQLSFGGGQGTTNVHVTATDIAGNTATTTFAVGTGLTTVTVGTGGVQLVRFFDGDGTFSRIAVTGQGSATLSLVGAGLTQSKAVRGIVTINGRAASIDVSIVGTDPHSVVTIYGNGGNGLVDLHNISSSGPIGTLNAAFATLGGNLTATQSIANLSLLSASNGTITIGGGAATNINIPKVTSETLNSSANINSLNARFWTGTGTIGAPSITNLNVAGSFTANLTAPTLTNFNAGSVTGGTWTVTGTAGTITAGSITSLTANLGTLDRLAVRGAVTDSTINTTGDVKVVDIGGTMSSSNFFTGVSGSTTTLPTSASSFTANTIGAFRTGRFVNSNVAAQTLSSVNLGIVQPNNSGTPFGVAAHSIPRLEANVGGRRLRLRKITTAAQVTAALAKQGITPQDLVIRIL